MKRILKILVVLIVLVSCSSTKIKSEPTKIQENVIQKKEVLYFQKTSCNGRCPTYVFKLFSDLTCELDVKLFFIAEGKNIGKISKQEYEALLKKMETPDFYKYNDSYNDTLIQDVPVTIVGYKNEGKSKKITCVISTPESLIKLNSEIEEMIKKIEWTKVD